MNSLYFNIGSVAKTQFRFQKDAQRHLRVLFVRFFFWNVLKLNVFAPRICFQIYVLILDQFKTGTELILLFL